MWVGLPHWTALVWLALNLPDLGLPWAPTHTPAPASVYSLLTCQLPRVSEDYCSWFIQHFCFQWG